MELVQNLHDLIAFSLVLREKEVNLNFHLSKENYHAVEIKNLGRFPNLHLSILQSKEDETCLVL